MKKRRQCVRMSELKRITMYVKISEIHFSNKRHFLHFGWM